MRVAHLPRSELAMVTHPRFDPLQSYALTNANALTTLSEGREEWPFRSTLMSDPRGFAGIWRLIVSVGLGCLYLPVGSIVLRQRGLQRIGQG